MTITNKIAQRFLFSRSSHSIVNLVAIVSAVAIMVPVAAMVVILSLHNGLQSYIGQMYGQFDSELQVRSVTGGSFEIDSAMMAQLASVGVVSGVAQSEALVEWGGRQYVATLKGVDSNYVNVTDIESRVEQGQWSLWTGDLPNAVVGAGVSYALAMSIAISEPLYVYALLPTPPMLSMFPIPFYSEDKLFAKGVYTLDEATDTKYIFTPIEFVWTLTGVKGKLTSIEIKPYGDAAQAQAQVAQIVGQDYTVKSRFEQRSTIFKIVNSERWLIFTLLMLVVVIASLSLAGCTLMMISEKRAQSETLRAMGLSAKKNRSLFTSLGMMIVGLGTLCGLILGAAFAIAQQQWGVIKMAGDTFLMDAYPCQVHTLDFIIIAGGVGVVGYVIVKIAAQSAISYKR